MSVNHIRNILLISLSCLLILLVFSFFQMPIDIDESWLGEQAYFLSSLGYVKSNLFEGLLHYEKRMLVFHKGFIFTGSLFSKVLGFELFSLRLVSLFFGLILLGLVYLYLKSTGRRQLWPWTALILLLCPLFFRHLKFYRPEMMLAATGFLSFLFLNYFFQSERRGWLLLAGVFAGLSVWVHLNGLIFFGAGAITLAAFRRFSPFCFFCCSATLFSLLYFLDVNSQWDLFLYQFKNEPSGAGINLSWYQPFLNLLTEHKRLFRKPEIIGVTSFFVFGSLVRFKILKSKLTQEEGVLWIYTLSLIFLLGLIAHSKTTKYAIPLFPFFSIIGVGNFSSAWSRKEELQQELKTAFLVFLSLYFIFGVFSNLSFQGLSPLRAFEANDRIAQHIPEGKRILAPMSFIFGTPKKQVVVGLHGAELVSRSLNKPWNAHTLCSYAKDHQFNYIVLNDEHKNKLCSGNGSCSFSCPGFASAVIEGELQLFSWEG